MSPYNFSVYRALKAAVQLKNRSTCRSPIQGAGGVLPNSRQRPAGPLSDAVPADRSGAHSPHHVRPRGVLRLSASQCAHQAGRHHGGSSYCRPICATPTPHPPRLQPPALTAILRELCCQSIPAAQRFAIRCEHRRPHSRGSCQPSSSSPPG